MNNNFFNNNSSRSSISTSETWSTHMSIPDIDNGVLLQNARKMDGTIKDSLNGFVGYVEQLQRSVVESRQRLQTKIKEHESNLSRSHGELKDKDDIIFGLNKNIADLQEQLRNTDTTVRTLQETISQKDFEINKINNQIKTLQQQLDKATQDKNRYQRELEKSQSDNINLNKQYQEAVKTIQERDNEIDRLKDVLRKKKLEEEEFAKQFQRLAQESELFKDQLKEVTRQKNAAEENYRQTLKQVADLKKMLTESDDSIKSQNSLLFKLQSKNKELEDLLNRANSTISDNTILIDKLQSERMSVEGMMKEMEKLKEEIRMLKEQLIESNRRIESMRIEMDKLKFSLKDERDRANNLQGRVDSLNSENNSLKENNKRLKEEYEMKLKANDAQIKALQREVEEERNKNGFLLDEISSLRSFSRRDSQKIEDLESRISELIKEREKLHKDIEILTEENASLKDVRRQNNLLQQEIERMKVSEATLRASYEIIIKQSEARVIYLQKLTNSLYRIYTEQLKVIQELRDLVASTSVFNKDVSVHMTTFTSSGIGSSELHKAVEEALSIKLRDSEVEIINLSTQLAEQRKRNDQEVSGELEEKISRRTNELTSNLRNQVDELNTRLQDSKRRYQEAVQELNDSKEQNKRLNQLLDSTTKELNESKQTNRLEKQNSAELKRLFELQTRSKDFNQALSSASIFNTPSNSPSIRSSGSSSGSGVKRLPIVATPHPTTPGSGNKKRRIVIPTNLLIK